jgi:MinD-like ATPase involved in chromosome partitioning or flagellar assembly
MFSADEEFAFTEKSHSIRDKCLQIEANLWLGGIDWLIDNNGSLLSATRLRDSFGQLRRAFDYLLIDAPAMSGSGDAGILGQAADTVVLVIEANGTRRLTARKAKEDLEAAGVRLLGTVLYNRTFPIPEGIYKRL